MSVWRLRPWRQHFALDRSHDMTQTEIHLHCSTMFNALASSVRSSAARVSFANARTLHSTPVTAKSVTEKVSEVADKVNKGVGKRLASAIESGEKVTEATKETIGSATEKAKDTVGETSSVAGKKKNQAAAGIQEAKENIQKEAKN